MNNFTERELCYLNVYPYEETYVRNGDWADKALYTDDVLQCKSSFEGPGYFRKILLKFNLDGICNRDFKRVGLSICAVDNNRAGKFYLYELPTTAWKQEDTTFNNCPEGGRLVTSFAAPTGAYSIDLTDYINSLFDKGIKEAGFIMIGDENEPELQKFISSKHTDKHRRLRLEFLYDGDSYYKNLPHDDAYGTADPFENAKKLVKEYFLHYENWKADPNEEEPYIIPEYEDEYCLDVLAKGTVYDKEYEVMKSRNIDTLNGYSEAVAEID